jgi:tetratricopeptide (TPR) repeat protein
MNKKENIIIEKIIKYKYSIVIVISFLLYAQVIFFGYVKLDDIAIIEGKQSILSDISKIDEVFSTDAFLREQGSFYRPLQTLTFMIESQFVGAAPWLYHLNNVIIHSINSAFVLWLFITLGFNQKKSLFLALLFSVHPLFTHAVAWVPSRNDLLLISFLIPSFIFYIKYLNTNKIKYILFHFLLFLLSVFTKETAMAFPGICLMYLYFIHSKNDKTKKYLKLSLLLSTRNLTNVAIWIAIILSAILARSATLGLDISSTEFGFASLMKNISIIPELFSKLVVPYDQPVLSNFNTVKTIIGVVLIAATVVWIAVKKKKDWGMIAFSLTWFFLFIIPGSMYRHSYADFFYDYLDHRAYLPMIGIFIFLNYMIPDKLFDFSKKAVAILLILILSAASALSFGQSKHYKDPIRFWFKAIKDNPYKAGFYLSLGKSLLKEDKYKTAQKVLMKGIHLMPHEKNFYLYLGEINFKLKEFDQSIKYLNQYLKIYPGDNDIIGNLGGAYANSNRYDEAFSVWLNGLNVIPEYQKKEDIIRNIVLLALNRGKLQMAYDHAKMLVNSPKNAKVKYDAFVRYAEFLRSQMKLQEAEEILLESITMNPQNWFAYYVLGNVYLMQNQYNKAVQQWNSAIEIDPNNINVSKALHHFYTNVQPDKDKAKFFENKMDQLNNN